MPQSLSLATAIEKNRLSSDVPFLLLVDIEVVDPATGVIVQVLHVARNPEQVVFGGNTYEAGTFDVSVTTSSGEQPDVSLSVNDYTQTLQFYMQAYGGGVGSNVTLYVVNGSALDDPPEVMEFFQITGATSQNYVSQFTLGAENTLMRTFPARAQNRDFCSWRYKSAECGYTGSMTSCDLTLQGDNGCAAHANSINFGGFPGLNANDVRYG
jgi:phage-related protein